MAHLFQTITKTDAKKTYKLDDRDLETLPYEQRLSEKTGYMMLLYSQPQVSELGRRKAAKLGKPLDLSGPGTSIISVRNFPKLRDWEEHMLNPDPPPRKIVEYTSPPNPAKPDPTPITWTPSKISGAVSVADACRLYCVRGWSTRRRLDRDLTHRLSRLILRICQSTQNG